MMGPAAAQNWSHFGLLHSPRPPAAGVLSVLPDSDSRPRVLRRGGRKAGVPTALQISPVRRFHANAVTVAEVGGLVLAVEGGGEGGTKP
jgi:hypothetical protein